MAFKKPDPRVIAAFDESQRQLIVARARDVAARIAMLDAVAAFVPHMSRFDERFIRDLREQATYFDTFGVRGGEIGHLSSKQVDELERISMQYTNRTLAEHGPPPAEAVEPGEALAGPTAS